MKPKKKKAQAGDDSPKKITIFFETSQELKDALEWLAKREDRTIKAQIERILRNALTSEGCWPWNGPPEE